MKSIRKDPAVISKTVRIGNIKALVLFPKGILQRNVGILWIHGGGYFLGMKEMVYMSRAIDLVKKYGCVVVSPGYDLSLKNPYPAAFKQCYHTLQWMNEHQYELGIKHLMVGGESAGGGLCAAVCMKARDEGKIKIDYAMPLYPMLSHLDTDSSKDNHGKVWNTKLNHLGWKFYLKGVKEIIPYASPSLQKDYRNLPPTYTFIGDGEPFYQETLDYIDHLQKAGVEAKVDIYPTDIHAFDMLMEKLEISKQAISRFEEEFEYALENYCK